MSTTATTTTSSQQAATGDPLSPTLWTAPQELSLLQSLTRFKPVGIHKHFRMLAVQSALLSSGTIPFPVSDHPHVSTTAGVWRKLESLYDLKALDEQEDAVFADVVEDGEDEDEDDENDDSNRRRRKKGPRGDGEEEGSEGERTEYWREFELPADGFEAEMWSRRLADDGEDEGGWSGDEKDAKERERESTVADSEDPRSSPVDTGSVRGTRSSGRRAAAVGKRLAEVKQEESVAGSGRGGSRRTSKAATPIVEDEDTEMQDADDQEDDDEDSGEEASDSDQGDNTEDDRKSSRLARGRGGRRGRGRRGRRGK